MAYRRCHERTCAGRSARRTRAGHETEAVCAAVAGLRAAAPGLAVQRRNRRLTAEGRRCAAGPIPRGAAAVFFHFLRKFSLSFFDLNLQCGPTVRKVRPSSTAVRVRERRAYGPRAAPSAEGAPPPRTGRGTAPDTPGSRFSRCDGLSDRCDRPTRTSQRTEAPSMWRPGSRVVLLFAPGDSIRERRGSGQRAPAHCEDTARTLRGPPAAPRSHRAVHTVPFPPAVPLRPRPVRAFALPSPFRCLRRRLRRREHAHPAEQAAAKVAD